jgi:hypothetical protein
MRLIMYVIGAIGAGYLIGVSWLIRDLPDLLTAERRGALKNRTPHALPIRRDAEPERFERLLRYRKRQLIWPALMIAGSTVGLASLVLLGLFASSG